MKSVLECWDILESCLDSPESELPKGASADGINEFEAATESSLPPNLREFYSRHDGTGDCFFGPYGIGGGDQGFLSLHESLRKWRSQCEAAQQVEAMGNLGEQEGPIRHNYWNRRWLPIADNGCGDLIFVDFDPAENGTVGQIVDWWHEPAKSTFLYHTFSEFLDEIANGITSGQYEFQFIG